jgi:predicted nucleic acid-binding protein
VSQSVAVLDASVGVKWFRHEPGTAEAVALLECHRDGDTVLAVPVVFLYEVLDVARRTLGAEHADRLWESVRRDGIRVYSSGLVSPSLKWSQELGCTLYDAAAPALAAELGAPLYSADRRAHGRFPGVRLIGEARAGGPL